VSRSDDDKTRTFVPLTNGTMVSHYRIIEKIGAGGMGEVYLAEDAELNRKVALKFLPPHLSQDADCRARFKREAQAAAKLDHPNIVSVFEVGEWQGRPFFSMQYIEGSSLRDLIESKKITVERVIDIAIQVCEGLDKAHKAGIIHRDIKPGNILIDSDGRPRIADFGLASCLEGEPITKAGTRMGTAGYMSPEQIRGDKIDHRTDLFSLGIVLYESIAARNPFAADNYEAVQRLILSGVAEPLARYKTNVSEGLQGVVERALEKDAAVRYQSAADMMADLRRLRRRSSDSDQHRHTEKVKTASRRTGRRTVFAVAAVLLLTVALWWSYRLGVPDTPARQNHLAVIPFANLAGHTTSQAFCDGLMETLTSKLTQLAESQESLLVVPASEMRDKGVKSAAQARKVFGVNLAVTGSVQQLGDRLRTTLNLVDAATERQIRSTILDEPKDGISSLQDSSVVEVARLLDIQLRPESRHTLGEGGTSSSGASRAYLEGRGYLQRYDDARSLDSAMKYFNIAVSQDSGYALAYAGLGEAYWRRFKLTDDAGWVRSAISYSSRALELNDQLAPVLVTLGVVHEATGQYQEAVSYLKRALVIDSTNSDAYIELASAYERLQRVDEAESTYRGAIALRPTHWRSYYNVARFYANQGRNEAALDQLAKAESLAPVARVPYESIGSLYTLLGKYERAKMFLERSLSIEPNYVAYSNLGVIFQTEGQYDRAVDMYERALAINNEDHHVWSNLAWMYSKQPNGQGKAKAAYERAIALAERNREINPNDAALLCYLSDCYWQIGEAEKSLALARQAVSLAPEDMQIAVRVGMIFEQAGLRNEALALVGKAVNKGFSIDQIRNTEELKQLVSDPRFDSAVNAVR
jgi:serine/threonine protein kinase/tetratricopeptide (TPR) repeat protein